MCVCVLSDGEESQGGIGKRVMIKLVEAVVEINIGGVSVWAEKVGRVSVGLMCALLCTSHFAYSSFCFQILKHPTNHPFPTCFLDVIITFQKNHR